MRDLFLLDPGVVFLNHGSFGACPQAVMAAHEALRREMERNPVEFLGRRSAALLAASRERLAAFVGAAADEIVYVPNATTGVATVVQSLPLAPGDEVVVTDHEYGACVAAWEQVCAKAGAVLRRATIPLPFDAGSFADRVLAEAGPRTRLVFASHVTSTTALVFPVADLCRRARERGILTLVDGAHAPGQIALDLGAVGADFYAGNCHKWLCAPKGAGFLHARREHHAMLHPPVVSWGYAAGSGGHTGFDAYLGRTLFERRMQWQGTRDPTPWLAVPAALDFLRANDAPAKLARSREFALDAQRRVLARNGLEPIAPEAAFAQMLPIPVRAGDAEVLRRRLFDGFRIEVPVTAHGTRRFVRLSAAVYTTAADGEALVDALAALGV